MNTDVDSEVETISEKSKDSTTFAIFEPFTRGAKFIYPPLADVMAKVFGEPKGLT